MRNVCELPARARKLLVIVCLTYLQFNIEHDGEPYEQQSRSLRCIYY